MTWTCHIDHVSLTSGTRLGPYEILSALGAGGMGEVYRATDTTLGRQVAIKIPPDAMESCATAHYWGGQVQAVIISSTR